MFDRFLNVPLDVPLLSVSSTIFLTWISVKHLRGSFFAEMASGFQDKATSQMLGSFLNVFCNLIVMLLYYHYYYSFPLISLVILSFPCFIILALIALSEYLCVII